MPIPSDSASWAGSLAWLLALAVAAFLVAWLVADRLHAGHAVYVTALTFVTAVFTVGYMAWSGTSWSDFLTDQWGWGVLVGLLAGAIPAYGMAARMKSSMPAEHGARRAERLAGDGVVYGISEGLLLSTLPALMAWQMVHTLGWSGATGTAARVVVPLLASIAVIVVHHLGYPEFRDVRQMGLPVIGCGVLTVGFLITGNALTAPVGHVLMHAVAVLNRTELPPYREPATA